MRGKPLGLSCVILILLVVSLLLLALQRWGMEKHLDIVTLEELVFYTLDDSSLSGESRATVEKTAQGITLNCKASNKYEWPFCQLALSFSERGDIDLSLYDSISLDVEVVSGGDSFIKVYLQTYLPEYTNTDDSLSFQFNEIQYSTLAEKSPFELTLDNFVVSPWWLRERQVSPKYNTPHLVDLRQINISTSDYIVAGEYEILVRGIAFTGSYISEVRLLQVILMMWVMSAVVYLAKSFSDVRKSLIQSKKMEKALFSINDQLSSEKISLAEQASRDALTGVLNRTGFEQSICGVEIQGSCVMFVDIDHFKRINDGYGHDVGDKVLVQFTQSLSEILRAKDFLCRWGGEEFIILCPETDMPGGGATAEKIRSTIESVEWPKSINVTCSLGVTEVNLQEDLLIAIERADKALYKAKESGRNKVCVSG